MVESKKKSLHLFEIVPEIPMKKKFSNVECTLILTKFAHLWISN